MRRDKKNVKGSIRLVILEKMGKALLSPDVDPKLLEQTLLAGQTMGEAT